MRPAEAPSGARRFRVTPQVCLRHNLAKPPEGAPALELV